MGNKYVLISAAKNEAAYIPLTIESVLKQQVLPQMWVIVNDGSTDETETVIKKYQQQSDIIHLISRPPDAKRHFAAKAMALKSALAYLQERGIAYDYIGNLDADVSFAPDFYEKLIRRMETTPSLAIAGGLCHEMRNGEWAVAHSNPDWAIGGATHFFRADFFIKMGGYPPLKYGGEDTVVEYLARDAGYSVTAENGVIFYHHKGRTFDKASLETYFRRGKQEYMWGSSALYELVKCSSRLFQKPFLLHGTVRMLGFIYACILNGRPSVAKEQVRCIRKQQLQRLGKKLKKGHS